MTMIGANLLLDGTPPLAIHDEPRCSLRNPEPAGESWRAIDPTVRNVERSDLADLILSEHRLGDLLSLGLSPLGDLVGLVILNCPEKQMVDIAARRVVAVVANLHTHGDRPAHQLPRISMCPHATSLDSETPITVHIAPTDPFMAATRPHVDPAMEPTFVVASGEKGFQWVPMTLPTAVMESAPPETFMTSFAPGNRTDTLRHVDTSLRVDRAPGRSRGAGATLILDRGCDG